MPRSLEFIRNLKIKIKLFVLLIILCVPLAYFAFEEIYSEIKGNEDLKDIGVKLHESELISQFIHEFQEERAKIMAAGSKDSSFLLEAFLHRPITDRALEKMSSFFEQNNYDQYSSNITLLNEFEKYRYAQDIGKLNRVQFTIYSNEVVLSFLDQITFNATDLGHIVIAKKLLSFRHLVSAKIHLGRMRSLLMEGFKKEKLSNREYAFFTAQIEAFRKSIHDFKKFDTSESFEDFENLQAQKEYKSVLAIVNAIENDPEYNPEYDTSEAGTLQIYNDFSSSIESFKKIEDNLISNIQQTLMLESKVNEKNLFLFISLLFLSFCFVGAFSFYIIKLISDSLSTLKVAADRIATGATNVTIDIRNKDEIGMLAESFRKVITKNIVLSNVAQAIGQGKYDTELPVFGEEDLLSNALVEMKDNLSKLSAQNNRTTWILNGVSEMNLRIAGINEMIYLAETIVSFLCSYTRSSLGILYILNESNILIPLAGHGLKVPLEEIKSFKLGTGSVGQVALEMQTTILDHIPNEYLKIETGLVEIDDLSIIIAPIVFAENLVGVIELGSLNTYTEMDKEFFNTISERIAISIQTLHAHMQTQTLLFETQSQAEELETQQEEMKQLNNELIASEEELKVSQEELEEKNSELQEKTVLLEEHNEVVNLKNKALEEAREAIELKIEQVETVSRYKTEFLANMSHELRTPLNSILILSKLLSDNSEKNLSDKQAEHARIIHNSGSDLLKLINEILDLSKIESGQVKLEVEEILISEISIGQPFYAIAKSKKIAFTVNYADDLVDKIETDKFRLEQIIKNFLGNAFKFTENNGKIEVNIFAPPSGKRFKNTILNQCEDIIAFSVSDTGMGIPKEKQESVFEAFRQADASTTRKYGGTGLGLTISRELATLLGGEISLTSTPGEGSTFTLFLPKKHHAEESHSAAVSTIYKKSTAETNFPEIIRNIEKPSNCEVSILIIEDDKGFNRILADFSNARNFNVHQAYNGTDGLKLACQVQPDAILLDINLPDISGWEVLKSIREEESLSKTIVHIMSAYDKEVIDQNTTKEDYLAKPVTIEMLDKAFTNISKFSDKSIEEVLIIEDNEIENNAISELLQAHDIKSLSVFSAEEALEILNKQKVDCIILDLNLPGINGEELLAKLKTSDEFFDIPIIIYSGKDLSPDEEDQLKKYTKTIIIKNEYSYVRLLDEVQLFLHKVNQKFPTGSDFKMRLHISEEVLKDKKVLIVDDDIRNVYSLISLLEKHGMDTLAANDGLEALQKLEEDTKIDIVLMDIMMPEMDGIEATKKIRSNPDFKNLPVIALTAKVMKGDREKAIAAGASDYVSKPVDTDKLLTLLRVWLYESR